MTRPGETAILALASKTSDLVGLKQMIIRLSEAAKRDQRSGRENEYRDSHCYVTFHVWR
jgi:hypothetical protein